MDDKTKTVTKGRIAIMSEKEPGARTVKKPNHARDIPLYVRVTQAEYDLIQERMGEAGTTNMAAFIRKMALKG